MLMVNYLMSSVLFSQPLYMLADPFFFPFILLQVHLHCYGQ